MSTRRPRGRARVATARTPTRQPPRPAPSVVRVGPVHPRAIALFEKQFGVILPADYRAFLERDGALVGRVRLLGLRRSDAQPATIHEATEAVRAAGTRAGLVPVEDLGWRRYACVDADPDSPSAGSVVVIDLDRLGEETVAAESFQEYERTARNDAYAITQVEKRARRSDPSKLPRSHHWRALRLCTQNVVVGLLELRHNRDEDLLEVAAFASEDRPEFRSLESTRALTVMLLSEAFKCGGSMAVRFLHQGRDLNHFLPINLQRLLRAHGLEVPIPGMLAPSAAVRLYLALTPLSDGVRDELAALVDEAPLEVARACYVVNGGIWGGGELELILAGAPDPERLLSGSSLEAPYRLLEEDVQVARRALLAGRLDRALAASASLGPHSVSVEDDVAALPRAVVSGGDAVRYDLDRELLMPWAWPESAERPAAGAAVAFLRPWDLERLEVGLAAEIDNVATAASDGSERWLVVPRDATTAPREAREIWAAKAKAMGVVLAVATDFVNTLDSEALRRLERSRLMRS